MTTVSQQRRIMHMTIGVVASVSALAWSLVGVEWRAVGEALQTVRLWPLVLALVVFWAHCVVRGYRWRYLLPPPHEAPLSDLFDGLVIGNVCTYLLPLRAGEFVRPYIVSRRGTYPYPIALASVVIERFFDLSAVLICFGFVVSQFSGLPLWVFQGARALTVLAVFLLLFIVVGVFWRTSVVAVVRWFSSFFGQRLSERLGFFADDVLRSGSSLRNPATLAKVLGATVLVWVTTFLSYYVFILMIPSLPLSPVIAVAVTVIVALAVAAPSAPGFLGIYQAGCVGALNLFGVPTEDAVAFALVSHAVQYVIVLLFGAASLQRQGVRWGELRKRVQHEESPLEVVSVLEQDARQGDQ